MKKVLIVLGALVALLLLFLGVVLFAGSRAPVEHTAASRASFAATPADVWGRVGDLESWPTWNSAIDTGAREADRDGKPYWRFEGSFGPLPMVVDERVEGARLVTRIPVDAGLGFSGTWTYVLAPNASGGATLTITEDGRTDSLLFRGMTALFLDPHMTMDAVLVDLGQSLGETVAPEHVEP